MELLLKLLKELCTIEKRACNWSLALILFTTRMVLYGTDFGTTRKLFSARLDFAVNRCFDYTN